MAVTNFIPELWSAKLLIPLRAALVYANLCNRDYEGEIREKGDTVNITNFTDPTVATYSGTVSWNDLTDATQALAIDQAKYFAFKVNDVDKRQAAGDFAGSAMTGAAYSLAFAADSYVSGLLAAGVVAGNQLGNITLNPSTPGDAYDDILLPLREKLVQNNVPDGERWVVVPPEMYSVLLKDDRFLDASQSGSDQALRRGFVGRIAGFDVYESNTVPYTGTGINKRWKVVAGHNIAATYADQIVSTEAMRLETAFADGIRGLHVYGAKVTRSSALASAAVDVSAS